MEEALALHSKLRANVLFFDYRGYGFSDGEPTEPGLIRDAHAALRWLWKRAHDGQINGSRIFITGRSLGGAVALHLAAALEMEYARANCLDCCCLSCDHL